jgi:hypothetical protein
MSRTSGRKTIARAIATRWRWPPLSAVGRRFLAALKPTTSSASSTRWRASSPLILRMSSGKRTFASTVMWGKSAYSWKMKPRLRWCGCASVMSRPMSRT